MGPTTVAMDGYDERDLLADVGGGWPNLEDLEIGDDADEDPPPAAA